MPQEREKCDNEMNKNRKNIKLVVLGDIGRSPRMQYHALSLTQMGHLVDVIGYGDTEPESLKSEPLLLYHYLVPCPRVPLFKLINYAFKTVFQAVNLLFLLAFTATADIVMVQNPPAIPALVVCWIYAKLVRAKFIIDWHNYGHTIMAMNVGEGSALTLITGKVEFFMGRQADCNFCVTLAMREDLKKNHNIQAITLYDKPPEKFRSISLREKHDFIRKLCTEDTTGVLKSLFESDNDGQKDGTIFTSQTVDGGVELNDRRPGLLISSTSWTEDEDFSVLLTALEDYENHHKNGNQMKLPDLICIITGKGPLKDYYCTKISQLNWKHIKIITPWLKSTDYPLMLASADLGVSLHTSSSSLDLPMKVVDMFGCGLPVCGFDFKCLDELIQHGENGYKFKTSLELSKYIIRWFEGFAFNLKQAEVRRKFAENLQAFQRLRWKENWTNVARPEFE